MISDPLFYLLAAAGILITGISKGGFGATLGGLGVPLMALAIDPVSAAAIMLPILCMMDLFGLWAYRGLWDIGHVAVLASGALLGILIGTASFSALDPTVIRLIVGVIAVTFALRFRLDARSARPGPPAVPDRSYGAILGAVAGFTSFIAHAGGPPVQMYLLPKRLDRTVYQATTVLFFAIINYLKLVPYGLLGQLNRTNLTTALVLAPLAPIGILMGVWLHKRVSDAMFYRLCYSLLLVTGLKLSYDGIMGLVAD